MNFATLFILISQLAFYVNSESNCGNLIKRYYDCKNIKILLNKESPVFNNNQLNEKFIDRALLSMTLADALNLQRLIYSSTQNCSSNEICQCMAMGEQFFSAEYKTFFRDEHIFDQFKQAVLKFESARLLETTETITSININQSSGVERFCRKYNMLFEGEHVFKRVKDPECIRRDIHESVNLRFFFHLK